eukprot:TRINITY_DN9085_c0_g1_i1.p1 TRINITY_DN9085_c0_g1~~TRINITY_DN9085_c0_g1_i1.p1  ORF type:complete len:781 (-),score=170.88 TRINITY_DN9085_c0_g1_i1:216-2558(-)
MPDPGGKPSGQGGRKGNRRGQNAGAHGGGSGKAAAAPAAAGALHTGQGPCAAGSLPAAEAGDAQRQRKEQQQLLDDLAAAEREGGYAAARALFDRRSGSLPPVQLSRAHLELAERAKRGASLAEVKYHLVQALNAQPRAAQLWLETCRTLDELGELQMCRTLLEHSLECCSPTDQLCLRLVRILERLGDMPALRALAGSLRSEPLDKTQKVLLEAIHAEVRMGNGDVARSLVQSLLKKMPQQGPIYTEACRIEGILGNWQAALSTANQGVQTCPKYGPLWFVLIRITEKVYGASAVKDAAPLALQNICQELHWKVHFEVAAARSRNGALPECRQSIGRAALVCPRHLRWKVWLLAARAELWDGSADACRRLLAQARLDAPARMQVAVCIERARTEEFLGNLNGARVAFGEAHACEGHDWKVFLEHIFMEARQGCLKAAQETAQCALELHPATGRLWSALVALHHSSEGGANAAMATFRRAAQEVAKSGEVWCEGARIYMNPLGAYFDLNRANKCLEFAVHLTPQYGDSFLELLRLRFLLELRSWIRDEPLVEGLLGSDRSKGSDNTEQNLAVMTLVMERVRRRACSALRHRRFPLTVLACSNDVDDEELFSDSKSMPALALNRLEVLCSYADPNYGFLWFWCRQSSLSSPREVMQQMAEELRRDFLRGGTLRPYIWALTCQVLGANREAAWQLWELSGKQQEDQHEEEEEEDDKDDEEGEFEESPLNDLGLAGPSELSAPAEPEFAMGSMRLSGCFAQSLTSLKPIERRRLIFGSDILCS